VAYRGQNKEKICRLCFHSGRTSHLEQLAGSVLTKHQFTQFRKRLKTYLLNYSSVMILCDIRYDAECGQLNLAHYTTASYCLTQGLSLF